MDRWRTALCLRLGLLLVLTLFATACGGGGETSSDGAGAGEETRQSGEEAELSGTLTVWDWQYNSEQLGAALKQVDEMFIEEHPDVEIEHVAQPVEEYNTLVQSTFIANSGPDVIMSFQSKAGVLNWTEGLLPLDDRISPELEEDIVDLRTTSLNHDPSEPTYGIPIGINGLVFYYKKNLFEQAGLDPDQPPQSFEEVLEACDALKEEGLIPVAGGNEGGIAIQVWLNYLWPSVADPDTGAGLLDGSLAYNDPRLVKALEAAVQVFENGCYEQGSESIPFLPEGTAQFTENTDNYAMFVGQAAETFSWAEMQDIPVEDLGWSLEMTLDGREPAMYPLSGGPVWAVPAYTDNPDLAWAYIEFLSSVEAQEVLVEVGGTLPINRDASLPDDIHPAASYVLERSTSGRPLDQGITSYFSPEAAGELAAQLQSVLVGETTAKEALDRVEEVAGQ